MRSIRRFMVIVLLAVITLLNFFAALQGYRSSMEKSQALFDHQLSDIARLLIEIDVESVRESTAEFSESDGFTYQIWSNDGHLLRHSGFMSEQQLAPLKKGYAFVNHMGYRWRTFVAHHPQRLQWIIVAERADVRYALAEEVVLTSVIPIVAELPVIGLFIWLVIGWGLKPLNRLATELSNKDPQDLTPLLETNTPQELTELVESSNGLLYRLRESFDREKRFSGDAAHELRTPISALKIHLHNLRNSVPEDNESLKLLNLSVDRMSHLVEQMLLLYRMAPDKLAGNFQVFDIYHMAQQQIIEQYESFSSRNQTIELEGLPMDVLADAFSLRVLLKNILDNANKYTPENGSVKVSVLSKGAGVVITVDDSGEGIMPEFYGRVFERFYRVHGDQHQSNVVGCGLGFSIIRHIVDLHKGDITLGPSCFQRGLNVTVSLPILQGEDV